MVSVQKNPILIDTVLEQLFRFVDYEALKDCRLVCQKWKYFCDRIFFKKTAFTVKHYPLTSEDESKGTVIVKKDVLATAIDMRSIFESINEEILSTATFKFQMNLFTPNIKDFYLEPNKNLMTSVELSLIHEFHDYDDFDDFIGPNLKRLKVTNFSGGLYTQFISISLDKLISISEVIELQNCNIKKNSVQKISSKVIKLDCFSILLNEKVVTNPQMNEIIDFDTVQKLSLDGDYDDDDVGDHDGDEVDTDKSHPIVNLSDCQKIKCLKLLSLTVTLDARISPMELKLGKNKYTRNGKDIKEFKLRDYFCSPHFDTLTIREEEHTSITVNISEGVTVRKLELCLSICPGILSRKFGYLSHFGLSSHVCDLSLLPNTAQSLCVYDNRRDSAITFTKSIDLPKLKHIVLKAMSTGCGSLSLPKFKDCPLLQDISLGLGIVNTDHLPVATKRLDLQNICNLEGSKIWKLDTLVVSCPGAPFSHFLTAYLSTKLFKYFQADLIVFRSAVERQEIDEKSVIFLMEMKNDFNLENIAFGPVRKISDDVQQKFSLPEFIVQRDNYYFVEGQTRRRITKREFDNFVEWD